MRSVAAIHRCEGSATGLTNGVLVGITRRDELLAAQCGDFLAEYVAAHLVVLADDVRNLSFLKIRIGRSSLFAFNNVRSHTFRVSPSSPDTELTPAAEWLLPSLTPNATSAKARSGD